MSLLDDLLAGLVFSTNRRPDNVPLDFVLSGGRGIVVASTYWWKDPHGWDGKVVFMEGRLVEEPAGWRLLRDDAVSIVLASPDTDEQSAIDSHRYLCDVERDDYLAKVGMLRTWLGPDWDASVDAWMAAMKARPVPNVVSDTASARAAIREVGILVLSDQDGVEVDALVVDARGEMAVANGNDWLESLGSQWVAFTPDARPAITEFLTWITTQRPFGPYGIARAETRQSEGTPEGIAFASVPRTV